MSKRVFSCGHITFEVLRDFQIYQKAGLRRKAMEVGDGKRGVVITKKENVEKEEGKGQNGEEPKSGDRGKEKSRVQEEGTQEEQKP